MQLRIVCPEECVFEGPVAYVAVPTTVGEFGILPHHASEICTIDGGRIRVSESQMGVTDRVFAVTDGYVQVLKTSWGKCRRMMHAVRTSIMKSHGASCCYPNRVSGDAFDAHSL